MGVTIIPVEVDVVNIRAQQEQHNPVAVAVVEKHESIQNKEFFLIYNHLKILHFSYLF